jgi:hypothetical protein
MLVFVAAMLAVIFVVGGCSPMIPKRRASDESQPPIVPMSDEQAMAQVVEPAKQMVKVAGLQGVTGGFAFEACNDQGEAPYRGHVEMGFALPRGVDPDAYFKQIAATMVKNGWTDGPPPGKKPFGTVIHTDTVMAIIGRSPAAITEGSVDLYGECRNMTDHHNDGKTNGVSITAALTGS